MTVVGWHLGGRLEMTITTTYNGEKKFNFIRSYTLTDHYKYYKQREKRQRDLIIKARVKGKYKATNQQPPRFNPYRKTENPIPSS
jgi:hypothetical protein